MVHTVWLAIHILGALLTLGLLFMVVYRENADYKAQMIIVVICCLVTLITKSLYIATDSEQEMLGLVKIEYLGKCFVNYFALSFILRFHNFRISETIMRMLVYVNVVFYIIICTFPYHNLYYRSYQLVENEFGTILEFERGPLFYVYASFLMLEMILFVVYVIRAILRDYRYKGASRVNKGLHYILLAAGLAPANILAYRAVVRTGEDFIPLSAFVGIVFLILAVTHYGLLDPVRNAKDSIVENMNEAIVVVDDSMTCYYINELAVKFFPELNGEKGVPKSSSIMELYNCAGEIVTLDGRNYEIRVGNLRGNRFEEENAIAKKNSQLQLISAVDVTRLMDQNYKMQELKEMAERAGRVKSTFLANMSHEIRTPMNAIIGITDILMRDNLSEEEKKDYLASMKSSGNVLLTLINSILDFSKIESGKMELNEVNYDLFELIRELDIMFRTKTEQKNLEFGFEVDDNVPQLLYGDEMRLRQVIMNIVNNAIKFTEVGSVKVRIRMLKPDGDRIKLHISVKDTGRGIREEDKEKMFEMFSQVDKSLNYKMEGTGLGLAISKELVELMGGSIGVHSQYGEGSDFFFTVYQTLAKDELVEIEKDEPTSFVAPKAKVLLVDDNRINLKVIEGLLAPLLMKIDVAEDGMTAIRKASQKNYDIIFMDHMMPTMDGVETTKRIRNLGSECCKRVPIIALTANAVTGIREELLAAGMDDFVAKPIDLPEICDIIRNWLPKQLIQYEGTGEEFGESDDIPVIEGLHVEEAIANCGSLEMFLDVLGDFYTLIPQKSSQIKQCLEDHMIRDYTIEVHALKSSARLIGAMELSEQCFRLEQLGNAQDEEALIAETPAMLELYRSYIPILRPYGAVNEESKVETSNDILISILQKLYTAMDQFDLDTADEAMKELERYKMPNGCRDHMELLRVYMADVAMQDVLNITQQMMDILKQMAEA